MEALRANGLLAEFAPVLSAADVHVARRLGVLGGETDERVLLAVALTVRNTRLGSVVLDLADAADTITADADDSGSGSDSVSALGVAGDAAPLPWPSDVTAWADACAASPLCADAPGGRPVHVVGSRLWLDRYWRQEARVAAELLRRTADAPADVDTAQLGADLAELFPGEAEADQRDAARVAATSRVGVVAGGPGTGKTTTIARLITVLRRQRPGLRVALAAPTGKAAARLAEAVHDAAGPLSDGDREALAALTAVTVHRLLGYRPGVATRFRHDRENRLPVDLVVVDECSMVSLTLMSRLLEALPPAARLVLVGDPDQLASVEAGAVLGDLTDAAGAGGFASSVATLRTVHRFAAGGPIAQLADHVRAGRADDALRLLLDGDDTVALVPSEDDVLSEPARAVLHLQVVGGLAVVEAARAGDADAALAALDRHRVLCAHRSGPRGVGGIDAELERRLHAADPTITPRLDGRYAGQPLLVTANDHEHGLFNGDTGVVVADGDELVGAFRRGGFIELVPLVRLSAVRPMRALTVHRAQGSQFAEVTVVLPSAASPLATRQTFYTAVTRATSRVRLIGSPDAVLACVSRRAARATGLRDRLTGALPTD